MINPYVLLGLLVAWVASVGGAFFYGDGVGHDRAVATEKKADDYARAATDAATRAAAEAIAKIKPRNTTIQQETRREIETNTVYGDCRVTPGGVHLANQALTGRAEPAGGGKLPGADGPVGRLDGGAAGQAGGDR